MDTKYEGVGISQERICCARMCVFHNLPPALTQASVVFLVMLDCDSDNCPLSIGLLPCSAFRGTIRKPSIGNKEWVWSYYLSRALIAAISNSKVDFLYSLYYVCSSWCKHLKRYLSGDTGWVIKGPYTLSDFNILKNFPLLSWLQRCVLFLSIL